MFVIELHTVTAAQRLPERVECGSLEEFSKYLRSVDWPQETSRALWANSGAPGIAVCDTDDNACLWFAGHNWAKELIPGGGSTFRESFELVIGQLEPSKRSDSQNYVVTNYQELERLFDLFFSGRRKELDDELSKLPPTDVYA